MSACTPGPWFTDRERGWIYSRPKPLTQFVIATMESGSDEDMAAMAAAQEMMSALIEIERLGSDGEHSGDRHARCREIARAAISKAQGDPSEVKP